ncbi:MAG: hypothetical protein R2771_11690 [Saprospiraceae bacterium]
MKKYIKYYFLAFSVLFLTSMTSCAKKYGCPGEQAALQTDKEGDLPTKSGKSNLFDKKMRKNCKSR